MDMKLDVCGMRNDTVCCCCCCCRGCCCCCCEEVAAGEAPDERRGGDRRTLTTVPLRVTLLLLLFVAIASAVLVAPAVCARKNQPDTLTCLPAALDNGETCWGVALPKLNELEQNR